jgi:hypothetical protein
VKNGPLKYWLKKIFYYPAMRVKRFIDYAPILWHDEDYDWASILRMLQYKIKRTRLHLDDHKMFEGYEERCAEMAEAETIIDRILKEDWLSFSVEDQRRGRRLPRVNARQARGSRIWSPT